MNVENLDVCAELKLQLSQCEKGNLTVVSPIIAVVTTDRSEWGSVGGIGYYDQVRVFYKSQSKMQEWQWRDRYSAGNDKPWLSVHGIGEVKVSNEGEKVVIEVELLNAKHGNRRATYEFTPASRDIPILTQSEQAVFVDNVDQEIVRVMANLEDLWKHKPEMPSPGPSASGYTSYVSPRVKQKQVWPQIGFAAFVTEEQIDHRVEDAQMRLELLVMFFPGGKTAKSIAEDHGYSREGGALLSIVNIDLEGITIKTKDGYATFKFQWDKVLNHRLSLET